MATAHVSVSHGLLGLFLALILLSRAEARLGTTRQRLEVHRHLRRLNKPAVKSIQSPDGDIIDCVHISHQPAFDHPFLQNHTIQMRPNFHPEGLYAESKVSAGEKSRPVLQMWHQKGASSVKKYGRKKHKSFPNPLSVDPDLLNESGHQHAIAYVEGDKYYGAKATINVWEPKIQQPNEFSLSQLWILGGSFGEDLNSIEAGWQVSPDLYGITTQGYSLIGLVMHIKQQGATTYCVLDSSKLTVRLQWVPASTPSLAMVVPSMISDPKEGNWWMQFGNDYVLGYWPSFLFSYLADSASMIEWGGEVVNSELDGEHTSTQMGSGHFPEEGFGKSSYFRNIQIVDASNNLRSPKGVGTFTEQSNCYDVQNGNNGDWAATSTMVVLVKTQLSIIRK
uniref:Neprosin PEP catalytic domain-containing protein n=1 Tax=Ananas comosus var. bracteatus TaxID=296719 RepID=A0A6V7QB25_ANACO|nr:unnamed protein product [Ananas comosus var. bracteatus]